ncbi:unnamed protein product [Moneuplotes crassus]|uniref:Uncharacterized protein n=1 Tax=Euplotes crassus TaxID=5936 RepID=A0AAD1XJK2_EUPCR|nr:unnamed protein product [Moneuplotes crassus]
MEDSYCQNLKLQSRNHWKSVDMIHRGKTAQRSPQESYKEAEELLNKLHKVKARATSFLKRERSSSVIQNLGNDKVYADLRKKLRDIKERKFGLKGRQIHNASQNIGTTANVYFKPKNMKMIPCKNAVSNLIKSRKANFLKYRDKSETSIERSLYKGEIVDKLQKYLEKNKSSEILNQPKRRNLRNLHHRTSHHVVLKENTSKERKVRIKTPVKDDIIKIEEKMKHKIKEDPILKDLSIKFMKQKKSLMNALKTYQKKRVTRDNTPLQFLLNRKKKEDIRRVMEHVRGSRSMRESKVHSPRE